MHSIAFKGVASVVYSVEVLSMHGTYALMAGSGGCSHFTTSTGLQAVVLITPATRLAARCRCAPSDHPVAFTMARLISSYVAHWLAVRIAALDCTQMYYRRITHAIGWQATS